MARIRSVSPGLRTSETAAQWDREARYAWVLLWGYLDDYGRGIDNPRIISADCFPLDDDVTPALMGHWIDLYEASGSVCRYEHDGKRYLHVLNWGEHQKPQHPSKVRVTPCDRHEPAAFAKWRAEREAEHVRVSGNPHEDFRRASPTRGRGGGDELEMEMSGGPNSGATPSPSPSPIYPDHCLKHQIPTPPPCGQCADARKAWMARPKAPLVLVTDTKKCWVHDETYTTTCRGCRADQIAADRETA